MLWEGDTDEGIELIHAKRVKFVKVYTILAIVFSLVVAWNYYDVMWWIQWYNIIESRGVQSLIKIYDICLPPECKVPYPPLAVLMFISLYALLSPIPHVVLKIILLKVFLVVMPGLIVYKVLRELRGRDVALLWLISIPFLQIIFSLQFDVIVALMVMVSTCMIAYERIDKAAAYLALATMVKHVVAVLVPIQLIFINAKYGGRRVLRYLSVYAIVVGLIALPFFIVAPRGFLYNLIKFHSTRLPQDLSLWAIPTLLLADRTPAISDNIPSLWIIPFAICYTALIVLFYSLIKERASAKYSWIMLSIFSSIALLLLITMNKVGNLNYLVWFVPISFVALKRKHIKSLFVLTTIVGLLGAALYAIMIYMPPASINAPMFIVEDTIYWNARALIAQSINYYVVKQLFPLYTITLNVMPPTLTPTDIASEIPLFRWLHIYRIPLILIAIAVAQSTLSLMIVLKFRWLKEYKHE